MEANIVCPRCKQKFIYNYNDLHLHRSVKVTKNILEISKDISILDQTVVICQECHEKEMTGMEEFVKHVDAWNREGIPISVSDLRELSTKLDCGIPAEYVKKDISPKLLSVQYDVKVKDKHKAPEFKVGLGKGVVFSCVIDYYIDGVHDNRIAGDISREMGELLAEYFEVTVKDVTEAPKTLKENL